jgi:hypothetical protein
MTVLSHLKLGLAFIGVVLFGYGVRVDHELLRWIGIGFLVAAALLRILERRRKRERPEPRDR